jgi:hypothetical protein
MKKTTFFRSVSPTQANIKKIIQSDENIGKLSSSTPALVTAAAEAFVRTLVGKAATRTHGKMTVETLTEVVLQDEEFRGLGELVEALTSEEPRKVAKVAVDDTEEENSSD